VLEANTIAALLRPADSNVDRRDIEVLLCAALAVDRAYLYSHANEPLEGAALARVEAMLREYERGAPVAYITGQRDFWDMTLDVNSSVLIPRPETELLVELVLTHIPDRGHLLELGTGSGAIALAIARQRTDVTITATDVSTAALEVARRNALRYRLDISWALGDWYAAATGMFDVIVSNPPYVAEHDPHLTGLVSEPSLALVAGPDGLDCLRVVIEGAPAHLRSGGWLLVEHGFDQAAAVAQMFASRHFQDITTVADLGGQPRVTLGRR
jgi:release factor glutamine methyltransferase